ncbi:hypothetical protein Pcinc_022595 [Petrolisthes cinctipes]|uniref:MADF domain-containing protein n=1 Tax=Petrolisthes cinctipes TaxID=88211 RepID=A0AAE1KFN7_PETCI|nr:hypothetical protein Pcinc_022595 [Petrolisthes cinctipes]
MLHTGTPESVKTHLLEFDWLAATATNRSLDRLLSRPYTIRDKRDAAYRKLVMKLKEIEPDANKNLVKKKINNLRSNVRKEQKKIDSSMKSGASADNVYKPSLWYFKLFDFIKDQDNHRTSVSNLSPEIENDKVNIDDACPEENDLTPNVFQEERREPNQPTPSAGISRPGPSNKRKSNDDISAEILSTVRDHFKRPQPQIDCCELLGRTVTMKMRGIKDKRLHIMFEKKINDLLFEAEMCALSYPNSTLASPQHYTPVPTPTPQHVNIETDATYRYT